MAKRPIPPLCSALAPLVYKTVAPAALALLLPLVGEGVARAQITPQQAATDASPAPSVTAQGVAQMPTVAPPTPPTPPVSPASPNGPAAGQGPRIEAPKAATVRPHNAADVDGDADDHVGRPRFLHGPRGNVHVASFAQAKSHLQVLYSERPRTLYTDCAFTPDKRVEVDQCRFRSAKGSRRAQRIEWEHVVPAEAFGRAFASWREGHPSCVDAQGRPFRGRRCAQRVDATYRLMEADMYNLYPEIGEVNQLRSNKPMGDPVDKRREIMPPSANYLGKDAFMPRPEARGDVARTYRYMNAAYPGRGIVGRKRQNLFVAWDAQDPVDAWECRRAWRIEAIQGNENPFVKVPCLEAGLWPSD